MPRDPAAGRGRDASPSHLNYTISDRLQRETSEPDGEPAEHRARIPGRALEVASHLARAERHPVRCLADGDRPHLRVRREVDDADEVDPTVGDEGIAPRRLHRPDVGVARLRTRRYGRV